MRIPRLLTKLLAITVLVLSLSLMAVPAYAKEGDESLAVTASSEGAVLYTVNLKVGDSYSFEACCDGFESLTFTGTPILNIYSQNESVARVVHDNTGPTSIGGGGIRFFLSIHAVSAGQTSVWVTDSSTGSAFYVVLVNVALPDTQYIDTCISMPVDMTVKYSSENESAWPMYYIDGGNDQGIIESVQKLRRQGGNSNLFFASIASSSYVHEDELVMSFPNPGTYDVYLYDPDYHCVAVYNVTVGNHDYVSTVLSEATCSAGKTVQYTCSRCGDTFSQEEGDLKDHSWSAEYAVDKPATCAEEGIESIHCTVCGAKKEGSERSIAKAAHAYGDWKVTKEPTCAEAGSREKACADCGDKVTEAVEAKGHTYSEEYTVDKPATCAEEGVESIHCTVCGAKKEGSERSIAKTAHAYGDWQVTKEPTCTEAGTREKTCTNCGDKVVEEVAATGHAPGEPARENEVAATCEAPGSYDLVTRCSACGEALSAEHVDVPALGHDWDEGVVTRQPTATEPGEMLYTCRRDKGHTRVEAIEPTGEPDPQPVATREMYRLYNPNSGEHFYTANAGESDHLVKVGWNYEGIGWIAPVESKTPVYRLYNEVAGDHHYTMKQAERDALLKIKGWKYEGIGWYSDDAEGTPLYRQYNPNAVTGSHNYTTRKAENDYLVSLGWHAEGIGWYGVAAQ